VELAWTIIPVLIVVALFMATARVIAIVQKTSPPGNAITVTAIGHQFWWEYRYPDQGVVTANELHVPVSDPAHPTPTFIKLLSADTDHSFWVPRLAGKTDLIPNHPNNMWIDPQETGVYLGQCAQYCGTQHAKMLLRVYVESKHEFERWIQQQRQPALVNDAVSQGQRIFEATACIPRGLRSRGVLRATAGRGERYGCESANHIAASGVIPHCSPALWRPAEHSLLHGSVAPEFRVCLLRGAIRPAKIECGCASTSCRLDHLSSIIIRPDDPLWWVFRTQWVTFHCHEAVLDPVGAPLRKHSCM
jgi:cytochrome c oxidase subunit II